MSEANDKTKRLCERCHERPKQGHWNSKWCCECAEALKHHPDPKLTPEEAARVRELAGTMRKPDIARALGISAARVQRYATQNGISLQFDRDYPEDVRREVCLYYAEHGKVATQEKFPDVKVRCIVERYFHRYCDAPRQLRWTGDELVEAAKLAGLVSPAAQAKHFNRPNAHAGSVKALWYKRFGQSGGQLHGLHGNIAKELVKGARQVWTSRGYQLEMPIEPVVCAFWMQRAKQSERTYPRRIYLWTDIEAHLRDDLPDEIKAGVRALARFQRWLYGTKDVRRTIISLQEKLETKKWEKRFKRKPRTARSSSEPKTSPTSSTRARS